MYFRLGKNFIKFKLVGSAGIFLQIVIFFFCCFIQLIDFAAHI